MSIRASGVQRGTASDEQCVPKRSDKGMCSHEQSAGRVATPSYRIGSRRGPTGASESAERSAAVSESDSSDVAGLILCSRLSSFSGQHHIYLTLSHSYAYPGHLPRLSTMSSVTILISGLGNPAPHLLTRHRYALALMSSRLPSIHSSGARTVWVTFLSNLWPRA